LWTSGWEEAAILVLDGRGEHQASTIAHGTPEGIRPLREWGIGQSLGNFYGLAAEWVGMDFWDAGKLMGLAAYGVASESIPITLTPDGYEFAGSERVHHLIDEHFHQQTHVLRRLFGDVYPFTPGDRAEIMAYAGFAAAVREALERVVFHLTRIALDLCAPDRLGWDVR